MHTLHYSVLAFRTSAVFLFKLRLSKARKRRVLPVNNQTFLSLNRPQDERVPVEISLLRVRRSQMFVPPSPRKEGPVLHGEYKVFPFHSRTRVQNRSRLWHATPKSARSDDAPFKGNTRPRKKRRRRTYPAFGSFTINKVPGSSELTAALSSLAVLKGPVVAVVVAAIPVPPYPCPCSCPWRPGPCRAPAPAPAPLPASNKPPREGVGPLAVQASAVAAAGLWPRPPRPPAGTPLEAGVAVPRSPWWGVPCCC